MTDEERLDALSPPSTKATVAKRTEYKGRKTRRKMKASGKATRKAMQRGKTARKFTRKALRRNAHSDGRANRANSWIFRVLRFFFHLLWLPLLLVGALAIGLVIGYTVLGEGPPGDVFSRDLWQYLYDMVNAEG